MARLPPETCSRNALLIICNLLWFQLLPVLLLPLLLLQLAECRLSAFTCCTLIENIMGARGCLLLGGRRVVAANRCCSCGCWCFFLHFFCLKSFSESAVFIKSFMGGQLNKQIIHPLGKEHKHTHTNIDVYSNTHTPQPSWPAAVYAAHYVASQQFGARCVWVMQPRKQCQAPNVSSPWERTVAFDV